jgi:hypothetical protein
MSKVLSERRKADREEMAKRVEALLNELGVAYESSEHEREINIDVHGPRGLCVLVDFDGASWQPDVHVLSWHIRERGAQLNDLTFGGNVNPHHKAKATYVAYGFDNLMYSLRRGLELAISGEAFLDHEQEQKAA